MSSPTDIFNRVMDAVGRSDMTVGDIEDGSDEANVGLRHYDPALRQLLRAAHWTFARKAVPMVMLADSTGQTAGVGTVVIAPWVYEYALPIDCMKARFVPQNYLNPNQTVPGNIAVPATPQTTVAQAPYGYGMRLIPSPFLVTSDTNYPIDGASNWQETEGTSPTTRTVVLTNVNQATLVYTAFMPYPSTWDNLFEQSLVDLLTARLALTLAKDQKFGFAVQNKAIETLKASLIQARAASANESGFPQTIDNIPDFVRARRSGGGSVNGLYGDLGGGSYNGLGCLWGMADGLSMGNGSVY